MRRQPSANPPQSTNDKAAEPRPASAESKTATDDGDVLQRLSRAISLVETIAVAMQTHEADVELGSIAEALDVACCQLRRAHEAVDFVLRGAAS